MNDICATHFHESIKCAEVFRTVDGQFHFICDKCTKTTQDAVIFVQHLAEHFSNPPIDESVLQLRILHVTDSDQTTESTYVLKQEYEPEFVQTGDDGYMDESDVHDDTEYFDECPPDESTVGKLEYVQSDAVADEYISTDAKPKTSKSNDILIIPKRYEYENEIDPGIGKIIVKPKMPTKKPASPAKTPGKTRKRNAVHPCPDCTMSFKSEKMLDQHCQILHSIRPFRCPQCPQTFSNTSKLNVHMNYHNKQLECDICHKKFALKSSIYFHLLTHIKEKQYECETCGEALRYKYQILQHKRKHGLVESLPGIVCELCGKTVQFPNQMREHMRRHNQQRVYKCTQCDKGFVNSGGLRTHFRRVHTNAVPFKCRWCDKMFRNYDARKAHERKLHDGEPMVKAEPSASDEPAMHVESNQTIGIGVGKEEQ